MIGAFRNLSRYHEQIYDYAVPDCVVDDEVAFKDALFATHPRTRLQVVELANLLRHSAAEAFDEDTAPGMVDACAAIMLAVYRRDPDAAAAIRRLDGCRGENCYTGFVWPAIDGLLNTLKPRI